MPEKPILGGKKDLHDLTELRQSRGWKLYLLFKKEHCGELRKKMLHDLRHEKFQDARCKLLIVEDHANEVDLFDRHYQKLRKEREDGNNN